MIEVVLLFGAVNVLFEFIVLSMLSPRTRLRVLGSHAACVAFHFGFLFLNLLIHWGTVSGTMSAIVAFVCSIATIAVAKKVFGEITDNRYYRVGLVRYSLEELK